MKLQMVAKYKVHESWYWCENASPPTISTSNLNKVPYTAETYSANRFSLSFLVFLATLLVGKWEVRRGATASLGSLTLSGVSKILYKIQWNTYSTVKLTKYTNSNTNTYPRYFVSTRRLINRWIRNTSLKFFITDWQIEKEMKYQETNSLSIISVSSLWHVELGQGWGREVEEHGGLGHWRSAVSVGSTQSGAPTPHHHHCNVLLATLLTGLILPR